MRKPSLVLIIGIGAMLAYMAIPRLSPRVRAVRAVEAAWGEADTRVNRPGGGTPEAERFLVELKAIDTSKAPKEIQEAMRRLTVEVEANLQVRYTGGDTNAANDRVADARRELVFLFDRNRGNAY